MTAPARNEPCPCGSGKRYKHCHGASGAPLPETPLANAEPEAIGALRKRAREASADMQETVWQMLLAASPGDSEALFGLGNAARNRDAFELAALHYEAALAATPDHGGLLNNLGLAYEKLGRLDDAEARFRHALQLAPNGLQPLANLAQNLFQQHRYADAIDYFDRLVARFPELPNASVHGNRGLCLTIVGRLDDADAALARAMQLDPDLKSLARNRGMLLAGKGNWVGAAPMLQLAAENEPDDMFIASSLAHCRANLADWRDDDTGARSIVEALRRSADVDPIHLMPLDIVAQVDDPDLQRIATRSWVPRDVAPPAAPDRRKERLHLGFVSSDFCNHPVPRLLLGLVERLDRRRFDVTAIAVASPRFDDEVLARSKRAFDHYAEFDKGSLHGEGAARLAELGIDVLFDLNGITGSSLPALFGRRAAPMQVNFLGYTASVDSTSYDYLIADSYCIPRDMDAHYAERVMRVDPCYLPSDPARTLADPPPTRASYALPDDAFVLAMVGAAFKITPAFFAHWMAVMREHPSTVLWLRPANPVLADNFRRHAERHGIAASRLVFAPEDRTAAYLARFRLADLVLDTFPYGSHTTVNDALFAGAPVLALAGRSFAARASASQLAAMGLDALIARDEDDYVRIMGELIADRARLARLTAQVRSDDARRGLFDMDRYAETFSQLIFTAWRELADIRGSTG